MKQNLLLFPYLFLFFAVKAQRPFITTWNTAARLGLSKNNQIIFKATGRNFTVSWVNMNNASDTASRTASAGDTITFATQGIYKVYITPGSGTFSAITFDVFYGDYDTRSDSYKLLSIDQWGDIKWTTFASAFNVCGNMQVKATDTPDLSNLTSLSNMFGSCASLTTNPAMNNWNTSHVKDMSSMFAGSGLFNQFIGNWDVSNVINMSSMFYGTSFNQPLDSWNVSNVTNISNMFYGAAFNQPLNNWNVGNVTNMSATFYNSKYNQSLDSWNVSNVTRMDFMFANAAFNQPIGNWDVVKVNNMEEMFGGGAFNQPIGNWNVSNVTRMDYMFAGNATAFNQPIDSWNVGNVKIMNGMFFGNATFNQPIGSWNTDSVVHMNQMFLGSKFNQPIGNWNTAKVNNMQEMFESAKFNQPIGNWNVSNVQNVYSMFANDSAFNQPIGNWDVSKIKAMEYMFGNAVSFNQPLANWNVSNVTDMFYMFQGAASFNQPLASWNVSNVTVTQSMFDGAQSFNQPIGNWNVSKVTNMVSMFNNASAFNQPLDNWNVSNVIYMDNMFSGTSTFNQPINNWNVGNVIQMYYMFLNNTAFNQPLDKWNTSKLGNAPSMFAGARSFNQNIGSWNLSEVFNMNNMLDSSGMDCSHYSQTLVGWAGGATTPHRLLMGAAGLTYDSAFAQAAHDSLLNIKGWTITGDAAGHCNVILPVNFISFNAIQQGNAALLSWHVADEINAKGYDVEKSANGYNYNAIGFVNAYSKQTSYTFTDNSLASGTSYYRIKEVDNDGKYMYSAVRKIEYSKFTWKINGNPVNNSSVTLMLDKAANISIQVVSSNGNVIKTIQKGNLTAGNYRIPLNINNISTGVYLVRLMVDDKAYTATVVK